MKDSFSGSLLVASSMVDAPLIQGGVCLLVHQDDDSAIGVMLNRPLQAPPEMLQGLIGDLPESDARPRSSDNRWRGFAGSMDSGEETSMGEAWDEAPQMYPSGESIDAEAVGESAFQQAKDEEESLPEETFRGMVPTSDIRASFVRSLHFGGPNSGPVVAVHASSRHAEAETADGIYVAAQRENLQKLICENQDPYRLIVGHLGWKLDQLRKEISEGWWHVLPATSEAVFAGDDEMWRRLIHRATGSSLAKWVGVDDQIEAHRLN